MNIINLTQFNATPEQMASGVFEPEKKTEIKTLLSFADLPSQEELGRRADALVDIAVDEFIRRGMQGKVAVLIGQPVFLSSTLERTLLECGLEVVYGYATRQKGEKGRYYQHKGFIKPVTLDAPWAPPVSKDNPAVVPKSGKTAVAKKPTKKVAAKEKVSAE